jgi:hypothetical protein
LPGVIPTGSWSRWTISAGNGSELNLPRLIESGVRFVHGDVRELADLLAIQPVQAVLGCSAEPFALAGFDGRYEL